MGLLNKYIASSDLRDKFFSIDEEIMKACEQEAADMIGNTIPGLDINSQENLDLVIRPMASVIAMYEIILQNIFSFSSVHTIANSTTTPEYVKTNILKSIASSSGIDTFGEDSQTIYNQILFFLKNTNTGGPTGLSNEIFKKSESISRLFFADTTSIEMTRNKISTIQLNSTEQMNFSNSGFNPATIEGRVYSRSDIQRYKEYVSTKGIELPGALDVYFDAGIYTELIEVNMSNNGTYILPEQYYIKIESGDSDVVIETNDASKDGIVLVSPVVRIVGATGPMVFSVSYYKNENFNEKYHSERIVSTDTLFKGFYPMFANIVIRSESPLSQIEKDIIVDKIKEYTYSKRGRIENISSHEMLEAIAIQENRLSISSFFSSELYLQVNMKKSIPTTFPLSSSDIEIPKEFNNIVVTPNTISLKIGSVSFETE